MKFKSAAAMALGLVMVGGVIKADAPAWYANTTVHGYVDANYQDNFNGQQPVGRVFDTTAQMFTVNGAKLAIANSDTTTATSGEIDLLYGPMAAAYNANGLATVTGPAKNVGYVASLAIEQAFLTQVFGPVTFKLGKYGTFVGNEVTDTTGNFNYSRSLLFGNEPFYNTGLEATYAITSTFSAMGYMGDGNSVDSGNPDHPDFGLQLVYTGVKNLSLTGTYYVTSAPAPAAPNYAISTTQVGAFSTNQEMLNFVGSYQAMANLAVVGEYLYIDNPVPSDASQTLNLSTKMQGYALYLDYQTPIANLKIDPRFEQWFQPDAGNQIDEYTITAKYAMGPITHYLEFRDDNNANKIYSTGVNASMSTTQNTLTYAATYAF